MCLEDLAVLVGENRREGAVQHPGAAGAERGAVAARVDALSPSLDADQLDGVVEERSEGADRVASAWARASSPMTRWRSRTSAG